MIRFHSCVLLLLLCQTLTEVWCFENYHSAENNSDPTGRNFDIRGRHTYWNRDSYAEAAAIVGAQAAVHGAGQVGGNAGGETGGYSGGGGGVQADHGSGQQNVGGGGVDMYRAASSSLSTTYGAPAMVGPAVPSSSYGAELQRPAEPMKYYYQVVPDMMTSSSGWGMGDEGDDDEDGFGIESLVAGALGLKKGKGLKALKLFKGFKLFKLLALPLLPILLPLLLPLLLPVFLILGLLALLPLLLLLLIPIPVVVTPAGGRAGIDLSGNSTLGASVQRAFQDHGPVLVKAFSEEYGRAFKTFLASSECVERVSCEVGRMAKTFRADQFAKSFSSKIPGLDGDLRGRIEKATKEGVKCQRFKCGVFM